MASAVPALAQSTAPAPVAAPAPVPARSPLPLDGLAMVEIRVSDMARSVRYYRDVLGFPEAFRLPSAAGTARYFKVNDLQYIELVPGLRPGELVRQARLVFQSSDLAALHATYLARGIAAGPIALGADGNPVFRIVAPSGMALDFIEYAPGSRQMALRGKLLGPRRIAQRLLHAGTMAGDDAARAFFQQLGLSGVRLGARGDYLETPASDRNLETKHPPLDPADPAVHDRYLREVSGAVYHFALEVPDMHAVRAQLQQRGRYDDIRLRTAVGNNRHWLIHLFDPDGSRTEFMSAERVADDIPSFSVMPPGPPAPPIRALRPGVYPWP